MIKADMLYQLDFRLWWVYILYIMKKIILNELLIFFQWAEGKLVQTFWWGVYFHFWRSTATSANQGQISMEWTLRREAQECSRIESPVESIPPNIIERESQTRSRSWVFYFAGENPDWPSWRGRIRDIEKKSCQERRQKYSINLCFNLLWERAC